MRNAARRLLEEARTRSVLDERHLSRAAQLVVRRSPVAYDAPTQVQVRECIELAGQFAEHVLEEEARERVSAPLLDPTPFSAIEAKERLRRVEPWVRYVRAHYFGDGSHPFASDADAAKWLRSASSPRHDADAYSAVVDRLQEVEDDLWILRGWVLEVRPRFTLRYRDGNGRLRTLDVGAHDVLARLAEAAERITRYLGVMEPADVVRFILCGEEPHIARAWVEAGRHHVRTPEGTQLARDQVVVTFLSPPVGKDLPEIAAAIADPWTTRGGGGEPTDADHELYDLVSEMGGVDRESQPRGFWVEASSRWAAKGNPAAKPNALAVRWNRLKKKLQGGANAEA